MATSSDSPTSQDPGALPPYAWWLIVVVLLAPWFGGGVAFFLCLHSGLTANNFAGGIGPNPMAQAKWSGVIFVAALYVIELILLRERARRQARDRREKMARNRTTPR